MMGEKDGLLTRSIAELAAIIRRGGTTPTELARLAMGALSTTGRQLNALVTLTEERALRQARRAEEELAAGRDRGPLHGIPWGAKDLLAAAGAPTTWGAAPYREQVLDFDGAVVERLDRAGAVLVGKLAMVELAGGMGYEELDSQFTGPGLNPWDTEHWSGGSSTGPGAAVAARLLPFAIGSETNGSIICPACYCGVTGLRPTYGRVSRFGAMALSWTLDKIGPLCRTAEDAGIVLAAIAGPDGRDPTSAPRRFTWPPAAADTGEGGARLGVPRNWRDEVQPEVAANFEASLEVLRETATIEATDLPDMPGQEAARIIISAEAASAFEDLIESGRALQLSGATHRVKSFLCAVLPARDYIRAMRVRQHIATAMEGLAGRYDAIVTPSMSTVALPLTARLSRARQPDICQALGALANLAGIPAISLPNGFGARGLPTGLMFTGRAWSESRLIALAAAYQARTEWHLAAPPASG